MSEETQPLDAVMGELRSALESHGEYPSGEYPFDVVDAAEDVVKAWRLSKANDRAGTMRRVLVRIVNNTGSWEEIGYTIADEAIRRPVTLRTRVGSPDAPPTEATLDGLALIGEGGKEGHLSIEPMAHMLGQQIVKIARTVELLWLPVNAHRNPDVDLWTIECVPLVSWFTLSQRHEDDILRRGGVDPATGEILLPPVEVRCPACGGYGRIEGLQPGAGSALPCFHCGGSGKAPQ